MTISNSDKAHILIQALPYIQQYEGSVVVIKYGGSAMTEEDLIRAVMSDIVLLSQVGIRVVLVHGGGPEITATLSAMGKESKFVDGLRYTDEETAQVVQMVLAGKINKSLVSRLCRQGGRALGLCGLDAGMLTAQKISGKDLGFVGEITGVDTTCVTDALNNGYIPVVATVAADDAGQVYNVNADAAAARLAAALCAKNLILMTDVRGLLREPSEESTLISVLKLSDIPRLKNERVITGGMIPKIDCCVEALRQGVSRAFILDGRIPHSVLIEMMTDEGIGTMIEANGHS